MPKSSPRGDDEMTKKITKGALMGYLRKMLTTNKIWAIRALERVFANQTSGEVSSKETYHANGVGFTVQDARILTSLSEFYKTRGFLTEKQMNLLYAKMGKYAGQISKMGYFSWEKLEAAYVKANVA